MTIPQDPRYAGVSELPPYRALLVVDMKDYSGNAGRYQTELTTLIPKILAAAFERASLPHLWERKTFETTTGDGYAIGLPPEYLPFLINPYLGQLQAELEAVNRHRPLSWNGPIRFRVSIHVGPVQDSGTNRIGDGSGAERVVLHRLLDSEPVRDLLTGSDAEVTFVAAIISPRAYEDAVLGRYAEDPPSLYVPIGVQVKTFEGQAYLRVPRPSGDLLVRGFAKDDAGTPPPAAEQPSPSSPAPSATQIDDHTGIRHGGVGNVGTLGSIGTMISGSSGPIHTGSGSQHNSLHGEQRP